MQSNASTQFVQANAAFAGTNATGTIASNGISVSVNPQTAFVFSNSNGVSFGTNGSTVTATVKTDYLTTAMASNRGSDFVQATANFFGTNISGTIASNAISLSVAAGGGGADGYNILAAGTQTANTTGTVLFNNGNGITFGMSNNSVITASYNSTQFQSTGNYLTTAAQSNQVVNSLNGSTGQISLNVGSSLSASTNGSSITFGLASNITTALQSTGNYLTTARASNDAIGLNTALTAGPLSWTVNSSGLSLNAGGVAGTTSGFGGNLISGSMTHNTAGLNLSLNHPAWLTTAMQSNAATISNINISAGTTSTNASAFTFNNANGITFGLGTGASAGSITASHNGITTARASNDGIGLNTAQSNVTWTVNSSGISFDARGYAGTGTTFNGANVSGSMTVNSNGVNLSLSAAAGGGGGVTPAISGSNGSFSFSTVTFGSSNNLHFYTTNGSVVASYADPDGWAINGNTAGANSTYNLTNGTFYLSGGANITLSQNGSTLAIIGGAGGGGGGGAAISAGDNSQSTGTVNFANSNNITFGLDGAGTMTASFQNTPLFAYANNLYQFNSQTIQPRQSTSVVFPIFVNNDITFDHMRLPMTVSMGSTTLGTTANTTLSAGVTYTINAGFYRTGTANATSLSSYLTTNAGITQTIQVGAGTAGSQYTVSIGLTYPQNGTGANATSTFSSSYNVSTSNIAISTTGLTAFSGMKHFEMPYNSSLPDDMYWVNLGVSSTTATQGIAGLSSPLILHSFWGMSQPNNIWGFFGKANSNTVQNISGIGSFTTAGGGTVTGLGFSNISSSASHVVPYIYMEFDGL